MIVEQFGIEFVQQAHNGVNVDPNLVQMVCYSSVTDKERMEYLEHFLERSQLPEGKTFKVKEFTK